MAIQRQDNAQQTTPTFRAGINYTMEDVSVAAETTIESVEHLLQTLDGKTDADIEASQDGETERWRAEIDGILHTLTFIAAQW